MPLQGYLTCRRKHRGLIRDLLLLLAAFSLVLNAEAGSPSEPSTKGKGIAAEVNGKAITISELEEALAEQISDLEQQISELKAKKLDEPIRQQQIHQIEQEILELKQKKLDELIGQQLLNEEAARRGMSVEELLAKEAYPLAPEVADEQVDKFYEQYKHRMVNRPESELKQKAREILKKYRLANERHKYIQSLRAGATISTFLASPHPADPWKALKDDVQALKETQTSIQKDLQEIKSLLRQRPTAAAPAQEVVLSVYDAPFKGKKDAKVTLIDFTDYQ